VGVYYYSGRKGTYRPRPYGFIAEADFMAYIDRIIGKKKVIHTKPKKD